VRAREHGDAGRGVSDPARCLASRVFGKLRPHQRDRSDQCPQGPEIKELLLSTITFNEALSMEEFVDGPDKLVAQQISLYYLVQQRLVSVDTGV
jgi:hypothetical protein